MSLSITSLFCCLDDLSRLYEEWERQRTVPTPRRRRRPGKLALSGTLFIMTLFHLSPFRDFKHFRIHGVERKYRSCFGDLPSCGRFVALMPRLSVPFCVLVHSLQGEETGTCVTDSTKLAAVGNLRIGRNRVFRDLARRGRTAAGWFHGFKLHLAVNHKGEIMAVRITPGNTDDRRPQGPAFRRQGLHLEEAVRQALATGPEDGHRHPAQHVREL